MLCNPPNKLSIKGAIIAPPSLHEASNTKQRPWYQWIKITTTLTCENDYLSIQTLSNHIKMWKKGSAHLVHNGRFPFNKNSVLKFRKFHVPNGKVHSTGHSGCTDPTKATARLVNVLVLYRRQKKGSWDNNFVKWKRTEITRPIKVNHLQSKSRIFRSDQTEMVRPIWCTDQNF